MAAILGLDEEAVRALCSEGRRMEGAEAVNFTPRTSGDRRACLCRDRGMELAKAKGQAGTQAPVSVLALSAHASRCTPAAEALEGITIRTPEVPVLQAQTLPHMAIR
jgi:[acyl-carrier-protein] S-malonyltransferase